MGTCFTVFSIILIARRKSHVLPVIAEDNEEFQAVAGMTTPELYNLDPRADEITEGAKESELEQV